MWNDLADFASVVHQYRSDVWQTQPDYLEVWLEKDALSRIFADVLAYFGVTLNVGRGYDSTSSIGKAARRLRSGDGTTVLYYGDFDPCGEDMVRSLRERLGRLGCRPEIIKCAITPDDIVRYNLPPDPCKLGDRRTAAHIARHGDVAVELDALPVDVLRDRIRSEVKARIDLEALDQVHARDALDRERLRRAFARLAPAPWQKAALVELAYLTGKRKGQLRKIEAHNVRVQAGKVTALAWEDRKVKNRRPDVLPLIGRAQAIVQRLWDARGVGVPLGGEPLGEGRSELRRACKAAGVPYGRKVAGGFVFHDTRRCALTNAQAAGIPDSVARTISGHRTDSAHRRYLITQEAAQLEALRKMQDAVEAAK